MTGFTLVSRMYLTSLITTLLVIIPVDAFAQAASMEGWIRGFQCGDNCYLTIIDKRNQEHTGLCTAPECEKWNEEVSMPPQHTGRHVIVTLGRAPQLDAGGNVMGRMRAFDKIKFLD